ncbi:LysR family transcriptional regulator, partial [Patulibacter sp. S7RM1-6]
AGRDAVALPELAADRLVVWGRPGRSGYADRLIGLCRAAGFEPRAERSPMQGTPPVTSVVDPDQFAFVTDPAGPALGGRGVVLELDPPLTVPTQALWRADAPPPLVEELLAASA